MVCWLDVCFWFAELRILTKPRAFSQNCANQDEEHNRALPWLVNQDEEHDRALPWLVNQDEEPDCALPWLVSQDEEHDRTLPWLVNQDKKNDCALPGLVHVNQDKKNDCALPWQVSQEYQEGRMGVWPPPWSWLHQSAAPLYRPVHLSSLLPACCQELPQWSLLQLHPTKWESDTWHSELLHTSLFTTVH